MDPNPKRNRHESWLLIYRYSLLLFFSFSASFVSFLFVHIKPFSRYSTKIIQAPSYVVLASPKQLIPPLQNVPISLVNTGQ